MPAPRTGQSPELPSWSEWKAQHQQKPWYRRYPSTVEWLFEHVNDRLHRWAFVEFLEHVGKFTVLIAVIVWVFEADNRVKERHYRAWELINSARGSSGDGGRRDALRDLNKDGVILAAAPLGGAWLRGVDLQGASLERADLRKADLEGANLKEADLRDANLWGANLEGADLEGATLWRVDLQETALAGAKLGRADLQGADLQEVDLQAVDLQGADLRETTLKGAALWRTNLVRANLRGADLQGAELGWANLKETDLGWANLKDADLRDANLWGANLEGADLRGVEGLTQEQLDSAYGDNTTQLPKHFTRPAHWGFNHLLNGHHHQRRGR